MAEFGDLRLVAIVQVLPRAEYLDRRNAGLLDALQRRAGQPVVDKHVRRKYMVHSFRSAPVAASLQHDRAGPDSDRPARRIKLDFSVYREREQPIPESEPRRGHFATRASGPRQQLRRSIRAAPKAKASAVSRRSLSTGARCQRTKPYSRKRPGGMSRVWQGWSHRPRRGWSGSSWRCSANGAMAPWSGGPYWPSRPARRRGWDRSRSSSNKWITTAGAWPNATSLQT